MKTNAALKVSLHVCVHMKTIPCKVRILHPNNSQDTRNACKFLKMWANFKHILFFPNVCKQTFHMSHLCISKKGVTM